MPFFSHEELILRYLTLICEFRNRSTDFFFFFHMTRHDKKPHAHTQIEGRMLILRVVWAATQLAAIGALAYLFTRIVAAKETRESKRVLQVPKKPSLADPRPIGSDTMTVFEYDLAQLKEAATGVVIQAVLILIIHIYWDSTVPMVTTSITALQRVVENKLVRIYLFGSTGPDFERPFKPEENPFAALLGAPQAQQQQAPQQQQPQVAPAHGKPASNKQSGGNSKKLN